MERQKNEAHIPYEIRTLTLEEVKKIYQRYLCIHFVEEERKPLKSIERMWEQNQYFALGMFGKEEKELMGYAFFLQLRQEQYGVAGLFCDVGRATGQRTGKFFYAVYAGYIKGEILRHFN